MDNTEQRGTEIENGSEWSNGTVHFDRTGPFSFRPKFPEILVEWIAPRVLVGVLCFTTNQEIQDGGQRESRILSNAMNAGVQEVYIYLELS